MPEAEMIFQELKDASIVHLHKRKDSGQWSSMPNIQCWVCLGCLSLETSFMCTP